jgi:hypothetical protein
MSSVRAFGVADVAADAADEGLVAAVGVDRHRILVLRGIVDDDHVLGLREHLARGGGIGGLGELRVHGLAVAPVHGHAHARRRHAHSSGARMILRVSFSIFSSSFV